MDRARIMAALGSDAFALPPRAFLARLVEILAPERRFDAMWIKSRFAQIDAGQSRLSIVAEVADDVTGTVLQDCMDGVLDPTRADWLLRYAPDDHHRFVAMVLWHCGARPATSGDAEDLAGMIAAGVLSRSDVVERVPALINAGKPFRLPEDFTVGDRPRDTLVKTPDSSSKEDSPHAKVA